MMVSSSDNYSIPVLTVGGLPKNFLVSSMNVVAMNATRLCLSLAIIKIFDLLRIFADGPNREILTPWIIF